jgi:UDP-N-acetylglucosamine acyltransferase
MATIDATARVADGARIGDGVEIGPYCSVGPNVELKDGVRLIGHVNVTVATTIGEATVVYPFASLGTPPQSVHYRGEPTKLVIGSRCELRENGDDQYRHHGRRRRNPGRRPLLFDGGIACRA